MLCLYTTYVLYNVTLTALLVKTDFLDFFGKALELELELIYFSVKLNFYIIEISFTIAILV